MQRISPLLYSGKSRPAGYCNNKMYHLITWISRTFLTLLFFFFFSCELFLSERSVLANYLYKNCLLPFRSTRNHHSYLYAEQSSTIPSPLYNDFNCDYNNNIVEFYIRVNNVTVCSLINIPVCPQRF